MLGLRNRSSRDTIWSGSDGLYRGALVLNVRSERRIEEDQHQTHTTKPKSVLIVLNRQANSEVSASWDVQAFPAVTTLRTATRLPMFSRLSTGIERLVPFDKGRPTTLAIPDVVCKFDVTELSNGCEARNALK